MDIAANQSAANAELGPSFEDALAAFVSEHFSFVYTELGSANCSPWRRLQLLREARERILAVETRLGNIRAELDTHSPISLLPPEVLSMIFQAVAEIDRPRPPIDKSKRDACLRFFETRDGYDVEHEIAEPDFLDAKGGTLGWIGLSHVTSLWRQILLARSSSSLWAHDFGILPRAVNCMLERAGDGPLDMRVYASSFREESELVWDLLMDVEGETLLRRIREIDYVDTRVHSMENNGYREIICSDEGLPALEKISLYVNEAPDQASLDVIRAPGLCSAHFVNVAFAVRSDRLNELQVDRVYPDHTTYDTYFIDIDRTRELLSSFRPDTLTHLVLDHIILSLEDPPWEPRLDFPNMQRMTLGTSEPDALEVLLQGIQLPEFALLVLEVEFTLFFSQEALQRELARFFEMAGLRALAPTGLAVTDQRDFMHPHLASLDFYTTHPGQASRLNDNDGRDPFTRQTHRVSLRSRYDWSAGRDYTLTAFLDALVDSGSSANILTLSYRGSCDYCALFVEPTLLARFPNIRTLHLVDPCSRTNRVMDALCEISGNGPTPIPHLECLWLQCSPADSQTIPLLDQLVEKLTHRYESALKAPPSTMSSMRLKMLRIDESGATGEGGRRVEDGIISEAESALRELVSVLEWNKMLL
ncbi:hypothetical protein PENSPDRAFT_755397 [Peniophora sp. CONT]|nr:hypothetical protein PENSPDRAFT_755397 [Peniophora sp. CONT]